MLIILVTTLHKPYKMSSEIIYDTPIPESLKSTHKPIPNANKSFPYNDLADDRRFEETAYSTIGTKIKAGTFDTGFDHISLMSGVRDKGRDCALFRNGKSVGLIQCKKFKGNLSKQVFGEEITRFVLYSMINPELIYDRNDFTYYIAVSTGFVYECSNFIDDFKAQIINEQELANWVYKNLRQPTLASLAMQPVLEEVREILSRITVKKITPQDFDGYFYEAACLHLQPLFFEVRAYVDNSIVLDLDKKFDKYIGHHLSKDEINEELQRGSHSLRFEKNALDDIPDSHIPRKETQELLTWIEQPAAKDKRHRDLNICLLAGNAGLGKTVILKDLYDELSTNGVPVLGLKADKLYASNIADLQKSIGLAVPVFNFIEQCKEQFEKVIVIIDQIDALSQSMSADRSFLTVYKALIDQYTHDANVRIIISVRIFDLHYDPTLRLYRDIKTITVDILPEETVLGQLSKIGISRPQLSPKLLQLLRVPNHLNVFSRIAENFRATESITSIQDLYNELWKQKVIFKAPQASLTFKGLRDVLYKLVDRMFKSQRISISEHQFEDNHNEIMFLESELLLKKESHQLQFFHQTFYDFVFAKQFVEKENDVTDYLIEQEQSIMIRSGLKMILSYLRNYDSVKYIETLNKLLSSARVMFHIKQMVLALVLHEEEPTEEEIQVVVSAALNSIALNVIFFEQARSATWFEIAIHNKMLEHLTIDLQNAPAKFADEETDPEEAKNYRGFRRHVSRNFLNGFVHQNNAAAWAFVEKITDQSILRFVLYHLADWTNPAAFQTLERCPSYQQDDPYGYLMVLENIAKSRPDYAWDKIKGPLASEAYADKSTDKDYEELRVLKVLANNIPEKMIATLFEIMENDLDWDNVLEETLTDDYSYSRVYLHDDEHLQGREYLYRLLAVCLQRAAKKGTDEFISFLNAHKDSRHKSILRLIFFGVNGSEEKYADDIYAIFCHLRELEQLKLGRDFSVEFRDIFQKAFPYFNSIQQSDVVDTLKYLVNKDEAFVSKAWEKPHKVLYWGKGKYAFLLRLPPEVIDNDIDLKKSFQELNRKYGSLKDKSSNAPVLAGMVRRPIADEALAKMSSEQWINSFLKYSKDRDPFANDDYLKGGLHEHSWAFKSAAAKSSGAEMIRLVETIISDMKIPVVYPVMGLWGLAEAVEDPSVLTTLFLKLLDRPDHLPEIRHCVSIAGQLVYAEQIPRKIVDFLVEQSTNYSDRRAERDAPSGETGINGYVTRAVNTVYGSAAKTLLFIQDKGFEGDVFKALENVLELGPMESRAVLYHRFAHLNNLNRDRSYKLFVKYLSSETDMYVIASCVWSLQYMGNYDFVNLSAVYEKLVTASNLGQDDSHYLFSILYFSFLYNKEGAQGLLEKLIDNNHHCRTWALREIAKHFYFNEGSAEKSHGLLRRIMKLSKADKERKMSLHSFQNENLKIRDIADIIDIYMDAPTFELSDSFITYLTQQCTTEPKVCIQIFNKAIKSGKKSSTQVGGLHHNNDKLVRFIVGAYAALTGNDQESKKYRNDLLQSFDLILKDFRFKSDAERVLEELI